MFRIETLVDPDGTKNINVEVDEMPTGDVERAAIAMMLGYGALVSSSVANGHEVDLGWEAPSLDSETEAAFLRDPTVRAAMDAAVRRRVLQDDPEATTVNRTDVAYAVALGWKWVSLTSGMPDDMTKTVLDRLEKAISR